VIGVDEAGRGPLAGPVVAGACLVPAGSEAAVPGVRDSKLIPEAEREELCVPTSHLQAACGTYSAHYLQLLVANAMHQQASLMRGFDVPMAAAFECRSMSPVLFVVTLVTTPQVRHAHKPAGRRVGRLRARARLHRRGACRVFMLWDTMHAGPTF